MSTLFAIPFTSSLTPHLVLRQHGVPVELRWLSRGPGLLAVGEDLPPINPKRRVPTLVLDSGRVLTEIAAMLIWLDTTYAPERAATERYDVLEWSVFLATDFHKQVLQPLFDGELSSAEQEKPASRFLDGVLAHLERRLSDAPTLVGGEVPTGADAYLLWCLTLVQYRWRDRELSPGLARFVAHMQAQPFVRETFAIETAARRALLP